MNLIVFLLFIFWLGVRELRHLTVEQVATMNLVSLNTVQQYSLRDRSLSLSVSLVY